MADVCVITGGGSGMGLAAAKFMGKEKILVISGRTVSKLENAGAELRDEGHTVYCQSCDTSDRESVKKLAAFAKSLGTVRSVINSAGLSPNMADGEKVLKVNALGTVYVNQEFAKVMEKGSVIVDIASNSAYSLPDVLTRFVSLLYPKAETDEKKFVEGILRIANLANTEYNKSGFAYALSNNFVTWYARKCAYEYSPKGIRVCSLSPGLISTGMGELEKEAGSYLIRLSAEKRMGTPEELGLAIASVADERNGYLAGVDVLVDGGSTNGRPFRK